MTLVSHAATIGIPAPTWLAAGIVIPFAFLGGFAGRPIGDRLGAKAFAMLAIALLAVAGAYSAPQPLPLAANLVTPTDAAPERSTAVTAEIVASEGGIQIVLSGYEGCLNKRGLIWVKAAVVAMLMIRPVCRQRTLPEADLNIFSAPAPNADRAFRPEQFHAAVAQQRHKIIREKISFAARWERGSPSALGGRQPETPAMRICIIAMTASPSAASRRPQSMRARSSSHQTRKCTRPRSAASGC